MKRFNITIVYEDGRFSHITNRLAEDEKQAIINEVKDEENFGNEKIISITVIERV
jgi:hypothetical protein